MRVKKTEWLKGNAEEYLMNAIEQSPEQSPAPNALAHLARVPIAQLSPDLEQQAVHISNRNNS
jgi:hypothetical protein